MKKFKLHTSGADFSPCRKWRYALWRGWGDENNQKLVMFVGLNPSTANEVDNDATIRRCMGFAQQWGYSGIYMLNLFAHVATDRTEMAIIDDPVGLGNDAAIAKYRKEVDGVIVGWGSVDRKLKDKLDWENRIARVLQLVGPPVDCLGTTLDGCPCHPSRLSYSKQRVAYQFRT